MDITTAVITYYKTVCKQYKKVIIVLLVKILIEDKHPRRINNTSLMIMDKNHLLLAQIDKNNNNTIHIGNQKPINIYKTI